MANPLVTQRVTDWDPVRKAFIESDERPTYAELSTRFSVPLSSLATVAADQGWVAMRARRVESLLSAGDAGAVIARAAAGETLLTEHFRDSVLVILIKLREELAGLADVKSRRARLNSLQTASFAVLNCSSAIKAVGIVGLPKQLRDGLDREDETNPAGWRQGILASINLTLNGLKPSGPDPVNVSATAAPTNETGPGK